MAAEKIIPYTCFENRPRTCRPDGYDRQEPVVINLRQARIARAIDVWTSQPDSEAAISETKSEPTKVEITDYRRRIEDGRYRVDPIALARSLLDQLLPSK